MIGPKETVAIGWCDNGMVDGKFTEGLIAAVINGPSLNMPITSSIRVQGNQIGRQRQALLDAWADQIKTDWLLWVDSDIVLSHDVIKKLWQTADKHHRPVVSGVYFISKENESSIMRPFPVLFNNVSKYEIEHIHPLPDNQVISCDSAGFGLVLMHKSVVEGMRKKYPNESLFAEVSGSNSDQEFISEDIVFFRKMKEANIPLHAHTGALVQHMKRFSLDYNYYNMYWSMVHIQEEVIRNQAKEQ